MAEVHELRDEVKKTYADAAQARFEMDLARETMTEREMQVKLENRDAFMTAKNGEQRAVWMAAWLDGDSDYTEAKRDYAEKRRKFRKLLILGEGLKLRVALV